MALERVKGQIGGSEIGWRVVTSILSTEPGLYRDYRDEITEMGKEAVERHGHSSSKLVTAVCLTLSLLWCGEFDCELIDVGRKDFSYLERGKINEKEFLRTSHGKVLYICGWAGHTHTRTSLDPSS